MKKKHLAACPGKAIVGKVGRRRVTPCYWSTFPSAPFRTGRAAFTASGSPVSLQSGSVWAVSPLPSVVTASGSKRHRRPRRFLLPRQERC